MFSRQFNPFQHFYISVLMPFHYSFNRGIEIGDGRGRSLQLVSVEFLEQSWMTYRHVFCGNYFFLVTLFRVAFSSITGLTVVNLARVGISVHC